MLTQQIEERRFDRGTRVNGDSQIEGLQTATSSVAIREVHTYSGKYVVIAADVLSEEKRLCVFECRPDALTARHFAHTRMPRAVSHYQDIAGKEGAVGSAQIEEHAV